MRLWRDIPYLEKLEDIDDIEALEDLEEGKGLVNIVLRSNIEPFWQSCIDRVEGLFPNDRYRVCAVGTPGIGKTFTTPLLLRMLLLKNSTVVYIRRSVDLDSWYYEFLPTSDGKNPYVVNVYPEDSMKLRQFLSLKEPSAYYVVDPGKSKVSCDPKVDFVWCQGVRRVQNKSHRRLRGLPFVSRIYGALRASGAAAISILGTSTCRNLPVEKSTCGDIVVSQCNHGCWLP